MAKLTASTFIRSAAALSFVALAAPALAAGQVNQSSYQVDATIEVLPIVKVSTITNSFTLTLDGEPFDVVDTATRSASLFHSENVPADLSVSVTAAGGNLPDGVVFWLFRDPANPSIVDSAMTSDNASDPAAFRFTASDINGGSASATFAQFTTPQVTKTLLPVVYGVATPSNLALPGTSTARVTWTIAPQVPGS